MRVRVQKIRFLIIDHTGQRVIAEDKIFDN